MPRDSCQTWRGIFMQKWLPTFAPVLLAILRATSPVPPGAAWGEEPMSTELDSDKDLLRQVCHSCHNERSRQGELDLRAVDLNQTAANAKLWEKVVRKLRTRSMPPPGAR